MSNDKVVEQLSSFLTVHLSSLLYEMNGVEEKIKQVQQSNAAADLNQLMDYFSYSKDLLQKIIIYNEIYEELNQLKKKVDL